MTPYEKAYNDAADKLNQEYFNKVLSIENGGHEWELSRKAVSYPYYNSPKYHSAIIRVVCKITCEACLSSFEDYSDFDADKDCVYGAVVNYFDGDPYGSWWHNTFDITRIATFPSCNYYSSFDFFLKKQPTCNEVIIRNVIL